MTYGPIKRDISKKVPSTAEELLTYFRQELLESYRQCRDVVNRIATGLDGGALTLGAFTVRFVTAGPPTDPDPDGSLAIRADGVAGSVIYHREAGVWVAIA